MGGNGEKVPSLVECFLDHPELLVVQVEDSLLEVPHSPVDELGATTAGTTREVIFLHQSGAEPCGKGGGGGGGGGWREGCTCEYECMYV